MTDFLVPGRILPQSWQVVWGSSLARICQRSTLWPLFLKQSIQWRRASPWTWQLRHTPPTIQEYSFCSVSTCLNIKDGWLCSEWYANVPLTDYCIVYTVKEKKNQLKKCSGCLKILSLVNLKWESVLSDRLDIWVD